MQDMTEQDLLSDLLDQEKQLISARALYIQEASCPSLRKLLLEQFGAGCRDEYEVFDQMRQKGYYIPKDAPDSDVKQAKNNMNSIEKGLH